MFAVLDVGIVDVQKYVVLPLEKLKLSFAGSLNAGEISSRLGSLQSIKSPSVSCSQY